jgi:hypothetical protein
MMWVRLRVASSQGTESQCNIQVCAEKLIQGHCDGDSGMSVAQETRRLRLKEDCIPLVRNLKDNRKLPLRLLRPVLSSPAVIYEVIRTI